MIRRQASRSVATPLSLVPNTLSGSYRGLAYAATPVIRRFGCNSCAENGIAFIEVRCTPLFTCVGPLGKAVREFDAELRVLRGTETLACVVLFTDEARAKNPCCFRRVEKLELTLLLQYWRCTRARSNVFLRVVLDAAIGNHFPQRFVVHVASAGLGRFTP